MERENRRENRKVIKLFLLQHKMKLFMVDLNEAFLLFSSHLVSFRFGSVHFRWRQQRQRRISYKLTHIFSKPMLVFAAPTHNFLCCFVSSSNSTIFLFLTCIHIRTQFHLPFAQWLKLHGSTYSINRAANKLTLSNFLIHLHLLRIWKLKILNATK